MKNEKWFLFKQFLHNELQISKEDVQHWVQEAVREEARILVERKGFDVDQVIKSIAFEKEYWGRETLRKELKQIIADKVAASIDITLK